MDVVISQLAGRLRDADAVTAELLSDVIHKACRRLPSVRRTKQFDRLQLLIQSRAWTDAVLALLALELPQWQVRRIVYDEGEWHCALSRQRELPDWLDQSIESSHADLVLAILSALVEVHHTDVDSTEIAGVAIIRSADRSLGLPFCCDNFS